MPKIPIASKPLRFAIEGLVGIRKSAPSACFFGQMARLRVSANIFAPLQSLR